MQENYIMPPYLIKGDKIGIVAPAGSIAQIEKALIVMKDYGYEPIVGNYVLNQWGTFAGTDQERLTDLQEMLDNPQIKAIFCARGGYGITRILDFINWERFINSPKWIVGFSDITAIHLIIQQRFKICSIHGCMPVQFDKTEAQSSVRELFEMLEGKSCQVLQTHHPANKSGNAEGILVGGNLTMLCNQIGTPSLPNTNILFSDKILFLEEVNEPLYHIDRMFVQLYRAGILAKIQGLLIGHFSIRPNNPDFGLSLTEIIEEKIKDFDYPILWGIPAGHEFPNRPLLLGSKIKIQVA